MQKKIIRKTILKIYRYFRIENLELRKRIVIYHCIFLIIPLFLLDYYVTKVYIGNRESEVLSSNYQVSRIAMADIDSFIQQIKQLTMQPLYAGGVQLKLLESNERSAAAVKRAGDANNYIPKNIAEDDREITNMANWILSFNKYINSVIVTDMNGDYVYRIIDNSLTKPFNPLKESWFKDCFDLNGKALLIRTFNFVDYIYGAYYNTKKLYVFSVARIIKQTNADKRIGLIMINISADYLAKICSGVSLLNGERVLLLDDKNNICYDTEEKFITYSISDPQFDLPSLASIDLSKNYGGVNIGDGDRIVMSVVSGESGWKLVRVMPKDQLYKGIWEARNMLTCILLAAVIISMLLTISISYGITKPLNRLILTIRSINKGDLSLRFRVRYKDEVGQLGRSFNKMIKMIDNLVNTVHVSQLRKREAELHALQAQINPHFIYNTLESIRLEAKLSGDNTTSEMVFALGRLLRYSINIKNKIVTVKDEIEHLKNYLILQNFRFDNKFRMVIDIEEDLLEIKIIKLIFQPIVENAICHGLETKDGDGVISLKGYKHEGMAFFIIEDNGAGMTNEQAERLNEKINDFSTFDQTEGGIGLKNINERLKLQYGEYGGIEIESRLNLGTVVRVRIPLGYAGSGGK